MLASFERTIRHASHHATVLSAFEPLPTNCTRAGIIFDVGTNTGADTRFFLSRGHCVIGVDANPEMLRSLRYQREAAGVMAAKRACAAAPEWRAEGCAEARPLGA